MVESSTATQLPARYGLLGTLCRQAKGHRLRVGYGVQTSTGNGPKEAFQREEGVGDWRVCHLAFPLLSWRSLASVGGDVEPDAGVSVSGSRGGLLPSLPFVHRHQGSSTVANRSPLSFGFLLE